ncbi:thioredoxin-like protein [Tuber borchii]|uniref:Thioredoxin-like protein n=1 Tax=Tuber borchii TaxID=42251 RepID=A0A2T6ZBW9_TUBBO|nr:thioredoxin-like protein [Tuber borchii]
MSTAAQQKVQAIINENPVAIFSKSYCPYCRVSKETFTEAGATFFVVELDKVDDGADLQAALKEINGQSTVPNIYINKEHIGGNSDLQAKKTQLPGLLKAAGAV